MKAAQAKDNLAQRDHFRQGKLQPEREQQKHHAQFGQKRQCFTVIHPAKCLGPDDQAHKEITQHRWQSQAIEQGNDDQRGGEDDDQTDEHGDSVTVLGAATTPRQ